MKVLWCIVLFFSFSWIKDTDDEMLTKINQIRSRGCTCGKDKMAPVQPLVWNDTLAFSAYRYARHLRRFDLFSHHSIDGKDVGQRLDEFGYPWLYAGENLAEGQQTFDEVIKDWLKSESHCKMIMNPNMDETGIGYFRGIWVQHFGSRIPEGMKRKSGSIRKVN